MDEPPHLLVTAYSVGSRLRLCRHSGLGLPYVDIVLDQFVSL